MSPIVLIDYDNKYDVLYLRVGDNSQSYGAEEINGISVFRDLFTENITGFLIFGFMEKYKSNSLQPCPYDFNIDYAKDVIPSILI